MNGRCHECVTGSHFKGGLAEAARASEPLDRNIAPQLRQLERSADIGNRIVTFWSEPQNPRAATRTAHRDINEVMLATARLNAFGGTADTGPASGATLTNKEVCQA